MHRCEGWEWAGRDGEDDISDILVTVDPAVLPPNPRSRAASMNTRSDIEHLREKKGHRGSCLVGVGAISPFPIHSPSAKMPEHSCWGLGTSEKSVRMRLWRHPAIAGYLRDFSL